MLQAAELITPAVGVACALLGAWGGRKTAPMRQAWRDGYERGCDDEAASFGPVAGWEEACAADDAGRLEAAALVPLPARLPDAGTLAGMYAALGDGSPPRCRACGSAGCPAAGAAGVDNCPRWQEAEGRAARGEYLPTVAADWAAPVRQTPAQRRRDRHKRRGQWAPAVPVSAASWDADEERVPHESVAELALQAEYRLFWSALSGEAARARETLAGFDRIDWRAGFRVGA